MTTSSSGARTTAAPRPARRTPSRGFRFAAWPLWLTLAGIGGAIGTVGTDLRPAAETEAWENGTDYIVTSADVMGLDPLIGRIGFTAGLLGILGMLVFVGAWRRHVEARFVRSSAAGVVTAGLIATAGASLLGYGWRGALANYLGPEAGLYDSEGLFVYYMLTDFGAYLPWFGALVAVLGMGWMAWVERSISRVMASVGLVVALFLLVLTVATGVPGLPGTLTPIWLAIAGIWLAVGRSRITEPEPPMRG
ncbi:hypothetical protein [Microbacterium sp.]|uniref:hypothetical protein n=1 Tax=Microbacterium sp. TaxID=51671 RepID=UPI0025EC9375|nr:hypothetical protein [Microbacterium sp.]